MSLETLREVRRGGIKPSGLIKVVVGKRAPVVDGDEDVISVTPDQQPALMDWRAVVGLPVALFICDGCDDLGERVFEAVVAAGGRAAGCVWSDVEATTEEAIKPAYRRMWRLLCQ